MACCGRTTAAVVAAARSSACWAWAAASKKLTEGLRGHELMRRCGTGCCEDGSPSGRRRDILGRSKGDRGGNRGGGDHHWDTVPATSDECSDVTPLAAAGRRGDTDISLIWRLISSIWPRCGVLGACVSSSSAPVFFRVRVRVRVRDHLTSDHLESGTSPRHAQSPVLCRAAGGSCRGSCLIIN